MQTYIEHLNLLFN